MPDLEDLLSSRTWAGGRHLLGEAKGDPLDMSRAEFDRITTSPKPEEFPEPLADWKGKKKKKSKKKKKKGDPEELTPRRERALTTLRQEMGEYLTPGMLAGYENESDGTIESLINQFRDVPQEVIKAASLAGVKKRGWYAQSAETIFKLFGHDSDDAARFAALLAALSPQNDVRTNLIMALKVWNTWEEGLKHPETGETLVEPRTDDPKDFDAIMGGLQVLGFKDAPSGGLSTSQVKKFDAWTNNTAVVLSTPNGFLGHEREEVLRGYEEGKNFGKAVLSKKERKKLRQVSPEEREPGTPVFMTNKVESFRRNLLGDLHRVTMDTWMEYLGRLLPGKTAGETQPPYHAYGAAARKVAKELGWTPAEVQETSWTTIKALMDSADRSTISKSGAFRGPTHEVDKLYGIEKEIASIDREKLDDDKKAGKRAKLRAFHFSKEPSARIRDVIGGHLYGFDEKAARDSGMDEDEIKSKKDEARERLGGIGVNIEEVNAFDEYLSFSPTFHELVANDPEVQKHAEAVTKRYERMGGGRKKRGSKDREPPRATGIGPSSDAPSRTTGSNLEALGRLGFTGDQGIRMRASNTIYKGSDKTRIHRPKAVTPIREIPTDEIMRKASWKLYHGLPPEAIYAAIREGSIKTNDDYTRVAKNPKINTRIKAHKSVGFILSNHHPDLARMRQETKRILDWLHQAAQDRMALVEFLEERAQAKRDKRSHDAEPPEPSSSKKIPTFKLVLLASPEEWISAPEVLYVQEKQLGSGFKFVVHAVKIDAHAPSERHTQAEVGHAAATKKSEAKRKATADKAQAAQPVPQEMPQEEPQQPQEPQAIPREKLPPKSKMMQRPGT